MGEYRLFYSSNYILTNFTLTLYFMYVKLIGIYIKNFSTSWNYLFPFLSLKINSFPKIWNIILSHQNDYAIKTTSQKKYIYEYALEFRKNLFENNIKKLK